MSCETIRESISALLDGEAAPASQDAVERHLFTCEECRHWKESAHDVTRRFRLAAADDAPAPDRILLAAVADASAAAGGWRSATTLTRLGLVAVALAQLILTVPALLLGSDHGAPIHVAHEMGSFDMALAIGFLAAAWKPSRSHGMQALVGVAALLLVATALIDLAAGRTSVGDEAPHLLAVAGWLLLHRLATLLPAQDDEASLSLGRLLRRDDRRPAPVLGEIGAEQDPLAPTGDAPATPGSPMLPQSPALPVDAYQREDTPEQAKAASG